MMLLGTDFELVKSKDLKVGYIFISREEMITVCSIPIFCKHFNQPRLDEYKINVKTEGGREETWRLFASHKVKVLKNTMHS